MNRARALSLLIVAGALGAENLWWEHVKFLADDRLEGRNAGSEGYREAARYVAEQYRKLGLKVQVQEVPLVSRTIDEARSSIELVGADGRARRLKLGEEAMFSTRTALAPELDAPLVFVGYGLHVPDYGHDDLAGLDLKGKVAVYLSGAPSSVPGAVQAHASGALARGEAFRRAGVIGAVSISNPKNSDTPWERTAAARLQASMAIRDASLDTSNLMRFSAGVNPAHAEMLFAASGHSFRGLLEAADAGKALPRFPLKLALRARAAMKEATLTSENVIGILEGADAKLRGEYLVLSAHLDHIGVNPNLKGDQIHNGAMDNASGVATLIEVARSMAGKRPRRSVLFAAVTAEEKGLLGSRYLANRPVVQGPVVANLNFDMFLPIHKMEYVMALGREESTLREPLERAAAKVGVKVQPDLEPLRNRFIRSDQYNFILRGVPALAMKVGYGKGSPEEEIQKRWLRERYHAPGDDLAQPVDLEAAATFNALVTALSLDVANAGERPRWNEGSFFRRFAR